MRLFPIVAGLAAGILFGAATPLSKALLGSFNGFQLAGLLYLGAAAVFLPKLALTGRRELASLRAAGGLKALAVIVLFGGFRGPVLLLFGLKLAASTSVSIWLNMELVATAILGAVFFKDHLDLPAIAGVALAVAAGALVSFQEGAAGLVPALFVTAACFCWGMDNHLTALVDSASPATVTFVKGAFAGTVNLIIGTLAADAPVAPRLYLLALLVGVLSYGASIVLYVKSAQQLGAVRSQVLFSTAPFWGILGAALALGEPVTPFALVAMLLVAAGIVLANALTHEHRHRHAAALHMHAHSHDDGHHDHAHDRPLPPGARHSHAHAHEATEHEHKHYPDLHHRHAHGSSAAAAKPSP